MSTTAQFSAPSRRLVDRATELRELRALADRGEPALALLYGRRRVGKTFLLDHAWAGRRHFYFLAADTTAELNRVELVRELAAWARDRRERDDITPDHYQSWRNVFRLFVDLAEPAPFVVVLDEFQYLMGTPDDVVSHLVAVWDRELRGRPLTLVLCGSEVATMERLERGDGPLYGRPNWVARLRPFDYRDAARMVPGRPPRDAAMVYGILGGTPRYLATIARDDDLADRVTATVLSPRGEVHGQLATLIEQEKGIRDSAEYRAVLTAVAGGCTLTDGIAAAAGLGARPHVVHRALQVLEGLELIERERNFGASERTPWRSRIADPAVRFWYRFVHPNRSRLETNEPDSATRIWRRRVAPHLNDYMGPVFERICRDGYHRYADRWGLSPATTWRRWEGHDRDRRSIELDIVARLDDGRVLTGEIKWSSKPVDIDVHVCLLRNLEDLARSGYAWAQDALAEDRSAGFLYCSAAGFTDHFRQRARDDPRVHFVTLEELYAPGG